MKYAALSNPAFTDTCLNYKYGHLIITDSLLSPWGKKALSLSLSLSLSFFFNKNCLIWTRHKYGQ